MAASSYDEALARLLVHEGGYSNHPSDPGGPTNFGITIGDYRQYVKRDATAADVRAMKIEEAKGIYRDKYWNAVRGDELPAGVDYCVFDYAVNSGTGRAPKVLQRLIGAPVTGRMDDTTVKLARARDTKRLIGEICDERLAFLQSLRIWPVFGKGWGARVRDVRAAALAMAEKAAVSKSNSAPSPPPGKGVVPNRPGGPLGLAAAVAAAGAALAAQMRAPEIMVAVLAATLAAALGTFFLWRWQRRRRQDAAAKS
jgi:lysozyme family protein